VSRLASGAGPVFLACGVTVLSLKSAASSGEEAKMIDKVTIEKKRLVVRNMVVPPDISAFALLRFVIRNPITCFATRMPAERGRGNKISN